MRIELNGTVRTIIEVDYNDIDDAINEFYALENNAYECVAYQEWNNDSSHPFSLSGVMTKYDYEAINALIETRKPKHYRLSSYLNFMVKEGAIEAGEYLITVSW